MACVALLGGSFNPPHVAHQMAALWVLSTGGADQVWLVPCYRHPFGKELVPFAHRLRMCELAVGPFATGKVAVSDVEQHLGGESRTYYTVQHLVDQHPEHRFSLVIGADILAEKDSWYRFDAIEELVRIDVVGRSGHPTTGVSIVLPEVSSTDIRRRLRRGEPVDHLVPAAVLAYIEGHGLYRGRGRG